MPGLSEQVSRAVMQMRLIRSGNLSHIKAVGAVHVQLDMDHPHCLSNLMHPELEASHLSHQVTDFRPEGRFSVTLVFEFFSS